MNAAIGQVIKLTVRGLRHELRQRRLPVTGNRDDLTRRLIRALWTDYDDGWTRGRLLNIRCVPFNGDGISPRTLVGLHVTGIDEARSRGNVKLSFSDNSPLFICSRRTTIAADPVIMYGKGEARLSGWPSAESPMRILGAAMAEWKNDGGKPPSMFLVLKLKGIGTNIYIGYDQNTGRSYTGLRGLYHADLVREELLLASSG